MVEHRPQCHQLLVTGHTHELLLASEYFSAPRSCLVSVPGHAPSIWLLKSWIPWLKWTKTLPLPLILSEWGQKDACTTYFPLTRNYALTLILPHPPPLLRRRCLGTVPELQFSEVSQCARYTSQEPGCNKEQRTTLFSAYAPSPHMR
jgi:hypothetical protein